MDEFGERRHALVATLREHGISDERVLAAIAETRREAFIPHALADRAYENVALPIGLEQTISQPYVVALMTQALALTGAERVLEVGTGSGYQAAILARLARWVVSVERMPALLERARAVLTSVGRQNVEMHHADGTLGWAAGAPYDRIIVTAAGPEAPASLLEQLAADGLLVMPLGTLAEQQLTLARRAGNTFEWARLGGVRFVPLVGAGGWSEASIAEHLAAQPCSEPPI